MPRRSYKKKQEKREKHAEHRALAVEKCFAKWKKTRDISHLQEHRFDDYRHMIVLSGQYFSIIFHHDQLRIYKPKINGVDRNNWDSKTRIRRYYCWNCDLERNIALLRSGQNIPNATSYDF